jgi:hypothetical protein
VTGCGSWCPTLRKETITKKRETSEYGTECRSPYREVQLSRFLGTRGRSRSKWELFPVAPSPSLFRAYTEQPASNYSLLHWVKLHNSHFICWHINRSTRAAPKIFSASCRKCCHVMVKLVWNFGDKLRLGTTTANEALFMGESKADG